MDRLSFDRGPKAPSFLRLPHELIDEIVSEIDSHDDLIAIALTSHALAGLVIPQHTQYRIIRVRHPLTLMWAHLARRADLTRNIREVHLCEKRNYTATDHYPFTLVQDGITEYTEEDMSEESRVKHICQALRHMDRLRVFTWSAINMIATVGQPTSNPAHENYIFQALSEKKSLTHLGLSGAFGLHVPDEHHDPKSLGYPVWNISNLNSLSLIGDVWIKPSNGSHLCRMLERSPNLEFLEIPMEFYRLVDCRFPRLKRLKLPLGSGATPTIDQSRALFIENHPTIEELTWFPLGAVSLPPNSLPSLKRLRTSRQVIETLDQATSPRHIEYLDVQCDSTTLTSLKALDTASLRKVKLHSFGPLSSVHNLAEVFPSITCIYMPIAHLPPQATHPAILSTVDWLNILPRFPNLEVFRGGGLWTAVNGAKAQMHTVIMQLVQLCPKLTQLDHCDFYEKRREWKRIVIVREGVDGENVRYEIHKPPPIKWFDFMDGFFD